MYRAATLLNSIIDFCSGWMDGSNGTKGSLLKKHKQLTIKLDGYVCTNQPTNALHFFPYTKEHTKGPTLVVPSK